MIKTDISFSGRENFHLFKQPNNGNSSKIFCIASLKLIGFSSFVTVNKWHHSKLSLFRIESFFMRSMPSRRVWRVLAGQKNWQKYLIWINISIAVAKCILWTKKMKWNRKKTPFYRIVENDFFCLPVIWWRTKNGKTPWELWKCWIVIDSKTQ